MMPLIHLDNNILSAIKNRLPKYNLNDCNNNYRPSNIIKSVNNIKYLIFNPIGRKALIMFTYFEDKFLCILHILGTSNYYNISNKFDKELVYNECLIFGYYFIKNNKYIFSFDKILNYNNFNNIKTDDHLTSNLEIKMQHFLYILNKISLDNLFLFSIPVIVNSDKLKLLFTMNNQTTNKYNINHIKNLYNIYSISIYNNYKKIDNCNFDNLHKIVNNLDNIVSDSILKNTNNINNINNYNNNNNNSNSLNNRTNFISNNNKYNNNNNNKKSNIINEAFLNIKAGANQDEYFILNNNEYYSNLLINSYNLSKLMNSYFRNIKENINLDSLEESDDEDEFNDETLNKYVDLEKNIIFKCYYNKKFKKWTPIDCNNYLELSTINNIKNIERNL